MGPKRVVAFVDGFNLYHAINDLGRNELKWLDIWKLCSFYAPTPDFQLSDVYYFSAYATWRTDSYRRHQAYVRALTATGIKAILGNFKPKTSQCPKCAQFIQHHEEKETDVNIALYMLLGAVRDWYDRALLVTRDSDSRITLVIRSLLARLNMIRKRSGL